MKSLQTMQNTALRNILKRLSNFVTGTHTSEDELHRLSNIPRTKTRLKQLLTEY